MLAHTRAMIAAAAFAVLTGKKAAGLYDHSAGQDRRIAAECRGDRLQGFDKDRGAKFGGTLPDILDDGDQTYVSLSVDGPTAAGYDRASGTHFSAEIQDGVVQVFDHSAGAWFAYDIQDPSAPRSYHRTA